MSLITIENLNFSYVSDNIIRDLSFCLEGGHIYGFVGKNAIGKTTVLKLISGLITFKNKNQIKFNGKDIFTLDQSEISREVTYCTDDINTEFSLSLYDFVSFGLYSRPRLKNQDQLINDVLNKLGLSSLVNKNVSDLSGGQKQLAILAKALVQDSNCIIFDETFSKLDLNHQTIVYDILLHLKSKNKIIVIVMHDLNLLLEWIDILFVLIDSKKIVSGNVNEILTESLIKEMFGDSRLGLSENPFTKKKKIFFKK